MVHVPSVELHLANAGVRRTFPESSAAWSSIRKTAWAEWVALVNHRWMERDEDEIVGVAHCWYKCSNAGSWPNNHLMITCRYTNDDNLLVAKPARLPTSCAMPLNGVMRKSNVYHVQSNVTYLNDEMLCLCLGNAARAYLSLTKLATEQSTKTLLASISIHFLELLLNETGGSKHVFCSIKCSLLHDIIWKVKP